MQKIGQLVKLTTQDVGKAIPITTSLIIAENYQVNHDTVKRLIRKYEDDFKEFGLVGFEIQRKETARGQRKEKIYHLNENQFYLLVTYMKNTEIARKYKILFVKAFSSARSELLSRVETRHIALIQRKGFTDVIKQNINNDGNFKKFAYSNYTRLINKLVLGMQVKKFKEKYNIPDKENVRDYVSIKKLEQIHDLESKIAEFIQFNDNLTDKELFHKIKEYFNNTYKVNKITNNLQK